MKMVFICGCCALVLAANGARAESPHAEPPGAGSVVLVPPRPLEMPEPEYPAQVEPRADVSLVLRLTIDAEGNVKEAEVVERSAEGFDAAARAALLRAHFSPATKDGKAISARILYRLDFSRPMAATAPAGASAEA